MVSHRRRQQRRYHDKSITAALLALALVYPGCLYQKSDSALRDPSNERRNKNKAPHTKWCSCPVTHQPFVSVIQSLDLSLTMELMREPPTRKLPPHCYQLRLSLCIVGTAIPICWLLWFSLSGYVYGGAAVAHGLSRERNNVDWNHCDSSALTRSVDGPNEVKHNFIDVEKYFLRSFWLQQSCLEVARYAKRCRIIKKMDQPWDHDCWPQLFTHDSVLHKLVAWSELFVCDARRFVGKFASFLLNYFVISPFEVSWWCCLS